MGSTQEHENSGTNSAPAFRGSPSNVWARWIAQAYEDAEEGTVLTFKQIEKNILENVVFQHLTDRPEDEAFYRMRIRTGLRLAKENGLLQEDSSSSHAASYSLTTGIEDDCPSSPKPLEHGTKRGIQWCGAADCQRRCEHNLRAPLLFSLRKDVSIPCRGKGRVC